ncbi:histone deacetylase [bacterium]|nr:histone deacetylase [Candidatus Omnitrophota bacterium]MBU2528388.1 histone deacetylase [bacterium]MBU3930646.1 histone deacetylase [bacterium]MBU4122580.1 histone deacetylase [bacterium]
MKIIYDESCMGYNSPGHPERPERIRGVHSLLEKEGFSFITPEPAGDSDILLAHSEKLLKSVKNGDFYEPDTPCYDNIYNFALLSCGAAIQASELAASGSNAFSLMRPPGHHATRNNLMGFCYFNSIAIAALRLCKKKKIAIVDFDCHHGNGTEDILQEKENCLYVSLHQSPCYPGTGAESRGNIRNFPLPPGTGGEVYIHALERALQEVGQFDPDYIGVSAGFDAYKGDPLTDMALTKDDFQKTGELIKKLNKPVFSVLEGGYSTDLPELVLAYLTGLGSGL